MSTSLLYHGFGIIGKYYLKTTYEGGTIIFDIYQKDVSLRCPMCNSRQVIKKGSVIRKFRTLPIGKKQIFVRMSIPRVMCKSCGITRQVKLNFAEKRKSYTKSFERYVLDLSNYMTIKDIAKHLNVSWDVVKGIQKNYLKRQYSHVRLKDLKQIAIDEINIGKGHKYLSIVLDLVSGAIVYVGEGKSSNALAAFWKSLKYSGAKIEAVSIDMSRAYILSVTTNLPDAIIVFDHFHVIKLFNDKLSKFRRWLYNHAKTGQEKEVLKGTRWLLLKNPDNLDETRDEHERLEEALKLNKPLATAYYMKEDLRRLWSFPNKEIAETFLNDWMNRANSSNVNMLVRFAKTLEKYKEGILSYYDYQISTGPLEGTNNKIKTMKRQAYGFRDKEFFKLKIMDIHNTRYALVG